MIILYRCTNTHRNSNTYSFLKLKDQKTYLQKYEESFKNMEYQVQDRDEFHSYAYDAIWSIAFALQNLIEKGYGETIEQLTTSANKPEQMIEAFLNVSFNGTTVYLIFFQFTSSLN